MKTTSTASSNLPAVPLVADTSGVGTEGMATGPGKSHILFSIPHLELADQNSVGMADRDSQETQAAPRRPSPTIVPISLPEANVLQTFIQGGRRRFLNVAAGATFGRLFVGSGVALFIGAVALIVWGPSPEQLQSDKTISTISNLLPVDQEAELAKEEGAKVAPNSGIQLTVSTSENGTAEPAEFDNPFTEANQVPAKVVQAVHFADPLKDQQHHAVQTVSHAAKVAGQPVWLSGTIEFDDDDNEDAVQLKRKHEHSRQSYR